jgi:tryptophan synthase alpha chain
VNRLEYHLRALKSRNEKAAIFFITAGDPTVEDTLDIMLAMAANGADCIELGMPFSDPIADGPVIQQSTARAMKNNVTIKDIFELTRRFRTKSDMPVVMMGYYNPIIRYDMEKLIKECTFFGVDGLIIADVPFEEGEEIEKFCKKYGVCLVYLLAPDIDDKRTESIVRASSGFVYCVAQYSTTGIENQADDGVLPDTVKTLRRMTDLPIALGFGISTFEKAREASRLADGIIIGSWLIKSLESAADKAARAGTFVREIKAIIQEK